MKQTERISRTFILLGIVLAMAMPLYFWNQTPLVHAQMADDGGWNPDVIRAEARKPLHLRLTSDGVMHGFAVGQMDLDAVDIEPGKVTNISLTFDKPGIYTFYCTRWCGVNHWRMRGTIAVSGSASDADKSPVSTPLYVTLGLDIDAPHDSPLVPSTQPSAIRGQHLASSLNIARFSTSDFYKSKSPYQVFEELDSLALSDSEKWEVVSSIWKSNTSAALLSNGKKLFFQNCAACHGEYGAGDGVFADDLAATGEASMQTMNGSVNMSMQVPVDFTDPKRMLGASPALLQGKILRGGMGTGMPMWGSIFNEEQMWDLIAYIYSFQFEYEK